MENPANKRSLALDPLQDAEGAQAVCYSAWFDEAEVFITNFPPSLVAREEGSSAIGTTQKLAQLNETPV